MPTPKFRVAICGAGIAGLALALTLAKYSLSTDIEVSIYEAKSEITPVGAGIIFWKRTWRIMQLLGLDEELAKRAIAAPQEVESPGFVFRRSDQHKEGYNFYTMLVPYGGITFHRADVVDVLKSKLPDSYSVHTSKRLSGYSYLEHDHDDGPVILNFADGTSAIADVLVGADGVHSLTRSTLFRRMAMANNQNTTSDHHDTDVQQISEPGPVWTGALAYRYLIPTEKLEALYPGHQTCVNIMVYLGKDKVHIVSYPVSQGRLINVVGYYQVKGAEGTIPERKWFADVSQRELLNKFKNFEPQVQAILQCMEKPSLWAIHALAPLPHYVHGRVALIGDAAHAMTAHMTAGAGQAIEDAYILGRFLSHPSVTIPQLHEALSLYESIRLPIANAIVKRSDMTGLFYEFNGPGQEGQDHSSGKEELEKLSRDIYKQWEWHWAGSFDEDWERARMRLEESMTVQMSPPFTLS